MILIENEQTTVSLNLNHIEADVQNILGLLEYADYDIAIVFVTNERIHEYNRDYRNIDKATDILSFAYHSELKAGERIVPISDEDKNLGDIIIAPQYVFDDLERWQQSFDERMRTLIVHGICHLLGYDHIEDADYEIMHAKEQWILEQLRTISTRSQN